MISDQRFSYIYTVNLCYYQYFTHSNPLIPNLDYRYIKHTVWFILWYYPIFISLIICIQYMIFILWLIFKSDQRFSYMYTVNLCHFQFLTHSNDMIPYVLWYIHHKKWFFYLYCIHSYKSKVSYKIYPISVIQSTMIASWFPIEFLPDWRLFP